MHAVEMAKSVATKKSKCQVSICQKIVSVIENNIVREILSRNKALKHTRFRVTQDDIFDEIILEISKQAPTLLVNREIFLREMSRAFDRYKAQKTE